MAASFLRKSLYRVIGEFPRYTIAGVGATAPSSTSIEESGEEPTAAAGDFARQYHARHYQLGRRARLGRRHRNVKMAGRDGLLLSSARHEMRWQATGTACGQQRND